MPLLRPGLAINTVDTAPAVTDILDYLQRWGVRPSASGYFDFDGDDETERWFTIRNVPRQKLSFWILVRYSKGLKAILIGYVGESRPRLDHLEEAFIADESLAFQPAVLLESKTAFNIQRLPASQEPYLVDVALRKEYPSRFWIGVQRASDALISGISRNCPGTARRAARFSRPVVRPHLELRSLLLLAWPVQRISRR
jgi:hypothetical protein